MTQRLPRTLRGRISKVLSRAWPELGLALALALTTTASVATYHLLNVQKRTKVRELTASYGNSVHHRLRIFEHALHNVRSFVMSRGPDVFTMAEFEGFVRGLDVAAQVPGLHSLDYVTRNRCLAERDPRKRAALDAARDTGHETMTDRLVGSRFEIYLPVYEPGMHLRTIGERRRAIRGWIRAHFRAHDFLTEITSDLKRMMGDVGVEVYDGGEKTAETRFFVSEAAGLAYLKPVGVLRKYLANHEWTVRLRPTEETFANEFVPVWIIIAVLGFCLSGVIYMGSRRSSRYSETLQRSESMLNLVINGVPAMISYIDTSMTYIYANSGYERMLGVPRDRIVGLKVPDLLGEVFMNRLGSCLDRALSGERVTFEHDLFRRHGETRIVCCQYIPHWNSRGEVVGVVALHNDVTEERLSAERLRAVARDNAKLYAEAQAVNRVKDEFLATLSHELRTPLNVILGYSELLGEEPLDEACRQFVTTIQRNARAQNQLIADLLDISAIINGKISFAPTMVTLGDIVRGAMDGVAFASRAKGVSLTYDCNGTACTINGDATRLQQIIWNLLSNAIKFTPSGGHVSVDLGLRGDHYEITVRDTGIGIDADFLPYVFDRFRQEDASRARRYGGLGLGLSIVRHLVELHGGSIRVSSDGKNLGAVFVVSLPKAERKLRLTEEVSLA